MYHRFDAEPASAEIDVVAFEASAICWRAESNRGRRMDKIRLCVAI